MASVFIAWLCSSLVLAENVDGDSCALHQRSFRALKNIKRHGSMTGSCPAWATGGAPYTFNADEWGTTREVDGGPGTPTGLIGNADGDSQINAACAWIAACGSDSEECLKRCPVAMAIGKGEGGWFPGAYAWDGNGRGLWQVNYQNVPDWDGCSYHPTEGEVPTPYFDGHTCEAYDPVKLAKVVIEFTNNGDNFNPPGKCWSTCACSCAPPYAPGYNGTCFPSADFNGPEIAESSQDACTSAIKAITGKDVDKSFYNDISNCEIGGVAPTPSPTPQQCVCPNDPDWACIPGGEDFQCGDTGGKTPQCVCPSPAPTPSPSPTPQKCVCPNNPAWACTQGGLDFQCGDAGGKTPQCVCS